jgi:two-component system sensor histidine kinase/response regulator
MKIAHDHFESLMNCSPAYAWITDSEGKLLFINDAYCKAFNLTRSFVKNKSVYDLYPHDIAAEYHRNIETVIRSNETLNTFEPALLADGSSASFMVCKFPLQTAEGSKRVGGWAIDVTEHERRYNHLTIQSKLLDTIQQAAIVTDREGKIQYWNKFAERLYGWTSEETIGRFVLDFVPETERTLGANIMELVRCGQGWNGEMLLHNKDGNLFSAYLIASPLFVENDEVKGVISVSMDITERKQSEETLSQQSKKLREISFIQSHEVRRPLSNILALVELLGSACSQKDYDELIPRLKECANQLDNVVRTIVWKAASE